VFPNRVIPFGRLGAAFRRVQDRLLRNQSMGVGSVPGPQRRGPGGTHSGGRDGSQGPGPPAGLPFAIRTGRYPAILLNACFLSRIKRTRANSITGVRIAPEDLTGTAIYLRRAIAGLSHSIEDLEHPK